MSGILESENLGAPDEERRYRLPAGHDDVLVDESSLDFMASLAQSVVSCAGPLEAVLDAFRSGGGVAYSAYGRDAARARPEARARSTRGGSPPSGFLPYRSSTRDSRPSRRPESPMWRAAMAIRPWRWRAGIPKVLVDGIDLDALSIESAREPRPHRETTPAHALRPSATYHPALTNRHTKQPLRTHTTQRLLTNRARSSHRAKIPALYGATIHHLYASSIHE